MNKKVKLLVFIFSLIAVAVVANFAFAQDFGLAPISNVISLSSSDPRIIIGRLVQFFLSFLGIIALILIMYAGFIWMTSNGDEDKINSAKQTLKNAIIGLAIVLSAWAITTFLLTRLASSIGSGIGGLGNNNNVFSNPGLGAIGSCSVENFYPENDQTEVARNTSMIITFKEDLNISTVCANAAGVSCACNDTNCNRINPTAIRIFKTDLGDACVNGTCPSTNANLTDVVVAVSNANKTLILTPLSLLGNPTTNTWYSVKITSDLKKNSDNSSIFKSCGTDYFNWKFEISTHLDLTPPQVVTGGIFPRPDNLQDIQNQTAPAVAAQSQIQVAACPKVYKAATITNITPLGSSPVATALASNYQGAITNFRVDISATSPDKALLFDANNISNLLGSADFDVNGNAKFTGYFSIKAVTRSSGNSWSVVMTPEQLADSLSVGNETYTFSSMASVNNNIYVNPNSCNLSAQASEIKAILSGNSLVNVGGSGALIILSAKTAGLNGNQISIITSNGQALQIQAFSGGIDRQDLAQVNDKKDSPMNTVIQINFSEAVNPIRVSGLASEVSNYIKVVNYNASSLAAGATCIDNSQCLSYKCDGPSGNKKCLGNYISGKFLISNAYKTVEFISDNECGVNGCGEKIYCLPANSHLAIEMKAADLKICNSNNDCLAYAPYSNCATTALGYNTCQNSEFKNYPTSGATMNGIIDTAVNSFDGDRDLMSDGPLNFYNDNLDVTQNLNKKDNYRWSFYVNNTIMSTPPKIETVSPIQGATKINLADPIKIVWNTLMMNSSLSTGSKSISNGSTTVEHKLINLKSSGPVANGYWVKNENIDTAPLDGVPDKTISWIQHTPFSESMSYRAQAGSGINDIYQNCFKPSTGVTCSASVTSPSCCFGSATNVLTADGNCP